MSGKNTASVDGNDCGGSLKSRSIREELDSILDSLKGTNSLDPIALVYKAINLCVTLHQLLVNREQRNNYLERELKLKSKDKGNQKPNKDKSKSNQSKNSDHSSETERKGSNDSSTPGDSNSPDDTSTSTDSNTPATTSTASDSNTSNDSSTPSTKPKNTGRKSKADLADYEPIFIPLDKGLLPDDAEKIEPKKCRFQDIKVIVTNVEYVLETYFSESTGKTYTAELPPGHVVKEDYGPGIKSTIVEMKFCSQVSESKILAYLTNLGVTISSGSVSNIGQREGAKFLDDYRNIFFAALDHFTIFGFDDTSCKMAGQAWHTHIISNLYFAIYISLPFKDRLTFLDVLMLRKDSERKYQFEESTWGLLNDLNISNKQLDRLKNATELGRIYDQEEIDALVLELFPDTDKHANTKRIIVDASAITYYLNQKEVPVIEYIMTDCAPQFRLIFLYHALCWIHEGRRFKKLTPGCKVFEKEVKEFLDEFWSFYKDLQDYQQNPSPEQAKILEERFDEIFTADKNYSALNDLIEKSIARKAQLLLVLDHPKLPLHNNGSELAARVKARYRDISFHNTSWKGLKVTDIMMSVIETCRRLGVNPIDYIGDRVTGKNEMQPLAEILAEFAETDPAGFGVRDGGP